MMNEDGFWDCVLWKEENEMIDRMIAEEGMQSMNGKDDNILNMINQLEQVISNSHQGLWISTKWKKQRMIDMLHILKQMRIEQLPKETTVKSYSDKEYQEAIDKAMEGE